MEQTRLATGEPHLFDIGRLLAVTYILRIPQLDLQVRSPLIETESVSKSADHVGSREGRRRRETRPTDSGVSLDK